jgi:hypothetical protein
MKYIIKRKIDCNESSQDGQHHQEQVSYKFAIRQIFVHVYVVESFSIQIPINVHLKYQKYPESEVLYIFLESMS